MNFPLRPVAALLGSLVSLCVGSSYAKTLFAELGVAGVSALRIGLAMRRGAGCGPALIPGNAKVGPAGTPIDVIFGGMEDAWDYDAMDSMTIAVPDAPRPDEILLVVAFLAGGRPNARIKGAPASAVDTLMRELAAAGKR